MPTFRERFEHMISLLRADPRVDVMAASLAPPASEAALRRAEAAVGRPLPASIRAFYEAHNGAFLLWGREGASYPGEPSVFGFPDYGSPPGCINILPVEEAMSTEWESSCHVNEIADEHWESLFGAAPPEGVRPRAVVIDNFSKYNHADLILGPEPVVVVSTDHGADMDSSDFMTFDTYLDCTLAVFGTNRYQAFGIGWTREPQRIDAWGQHLTLDEVMAKVAEDEA